MSKFDKKTIATVLAFASLFGNKTSATTINPQSTGAVGGAASSNSEKLKKTQGMGIGAKVAIGATALVGAYATANEVLGDTGLVNHPAMGRYTIKKTIEYLTRDIKKEEALIDGIIEFIDKLSTFKTDPNDSPEVQLQKLIKAQSEVVKNKDLIPSIKIDVYLANNSPLELNVEGELLEKSSVLKNLLFYKQLFIGVKANLSKMKFSEYCYGNVKFNLSKNNIFISDLKLLNPGLPDNIFVTLNKDGSLTIKQFVKQLNLRGKIINNFISQFTIPANHQLLKK